MTYSEFINTIKKLKRNIEYPYVPSSTSKEQKSYKLISVSEEAIIVEREKNEVKVSIQQVKEVLSSLKKDSPLDIERVLGASGNTRSIIESLLCLTPTIFYIKVNRRKNIFDSSNEKHNLGELCEFCFEYTIEKLGNILKNMYATADDNFKVAAIHMFGIEYAQYILEKKFSISEIIKFSDISKTYTTELSKGINIYKCLISNKYNLKYKDLISSSKEYVSFSVNAITSFSLSTFYNSPFSHRYLTSLLAKPFVILAGNSGTGKTRIARNLAAWLERKDAMGRANHLLVPVGADWTDNTKLLGYFNPLANDGAGHYVKTEILRFLEDAGANPHIPFFLILDEMNLSRVERYFSDFLSIMETVSYGEGSPDVFLELDGYPGGKLKFPRNLFITGTVNVDETTYMFSPKVLDRANVIEFKPESADVLGNFISDSAAQAIEPAEAGMAESFLSLAQKIRGSSRLAEGVKIEEVERILRAVYGAVQDTDFAFAFRTTKEMRHYVNAAYAIEPTASIVSVLDQQVLQKILPKIHGSRSQLKAVLERLAKVCHEQQLEESGRKIASMQRRLESSQFTSFM